jgi:hypothetical protein
MWRKRTGLRGSTVEYLSFATQQGINISVSVPIESAIFLASYQSTRST